MSWTKLLEKRYFPASASVVEDIACTQCGYNLRGLRPRGRCPECGRPVGESLYLLTKPQIVSASFTGLGGSYLAFLALIPAILLLAIPGMLWFALLVFAAGSAVRLYCAFMLRYKADLAHLPAIGGQAMRLLLLAIAEAIALLVMTVSMYLGIRAGGGGPWAASAPLVLLCWWLLALATACQATSFAARMGTMLGFDLIRRDATCQRIGLAIVLAITLTILVLSRLPSVDAAIVALVLILFLPGGFALLFTMLCLWHTGNAAAQSGELREDAVDAELESDVDRRPITPPRSARPRPDIKID